MNVTVGTHNVFLDLGFEPEEAENLLIRSNLMVELEEYIQAYDWTEEEAAAFFGEIPFCIRRLMEGDIDHFSIEKLIAMLVKTGKRIKMEVMYRSFAA